MKRLNDMGLIVIGAMVGVTLLAGYLVRQWHPKTVEGKIEQKIVEEVIEDALKVEEPKI